MHPPLSWHSYPLLLFLLLNCCNTKNSFFICHAKTNGQNNYFSSSRLLLSGRWTKSPVLMKSCLKRHLTKSRCLKDCYSAFEVGRLRGGSGQMYDGEHDGAISHDKSNTYRLNNNGQVTKSETKAASYSGKPSAPSPYEYIPITALDDYGQSTQLRHAMESASRFGTPVLACICCHDYCDDDKLGDMAKNKLNSERKCIDDGDSSTVSTPKQNGRRMENAIIVCSLQRVRAGVISSFPTSAPTASCSTTIIRKNNQFESCPSIHPSVQGMVRILATRDDYPPSPPSNVDDNNHNIPQHSLHTAIVTTGIQSDALFLQSQLQSHFTSSYWFRYNSLPSTSIANSYSSPTVVIKMVREILLDCLGYDWSEEVGSGKVSGGIGSAAPSYSENGDDDNRGGSVRAGRPLGVCTFLLGLDVGAGNSRSASPPSLIVIQANGASEQYVARAMGMESSLANERLSQKWKRCMSRLEVKEMMKDILGEIAREKGWLVDGGAGEEGHVRDTIVNGGKGGTSNGLTMVCETVTPGGNEVEFLPLE